MRDVGLMDDERQGKLRRERCIEKTHEGLHHYCEIVFSVIPTAVYLQLYVCIDYLYYVQQRTLTERSVVGESRITLAFTLQG